MPPAIQPFTREPMKSTPFALEIESDDAFRHRMHREALAREKRERDQEMRDRLTRPLVGSMGDTYQRPLFGSPELFQ